jgi:hypothetical protein
MGHGARKFFKRRIDFESMSYYDDERKKILEEIMQKLKQYYIEYIKEVPEIYEKEGKEDYKEALATIHTNLIEDAFNELRFKGKKYYYNVYKPDLVIELDKYDKLYFKCDYLWVEIDLDHETPSIKKYELMKLLSHKWSLLIFNMHETEYEIIRPDAWEEINNVIGNLTEDRYNI